MSVSYKGRYLSAQYKLLSIQSSDLMTDEEAAIFRSLLEIKQKINAAETKEEKTKFVNEKKAASKRMNEMIAAHEGPRRLNPACVCDTRSFVDGQPPDYISWDNVKETRRIQEFCSEESRILGVEKDSVFLGKIIMAWKTIEILEQVVINGLVVPLLDPETGEIKDVPYRFHTASAGQLRRDKVQLLSCEAYDKMYDSAYCGLHWDEINEHGGINVNKLLAYYGLPASATERWKLLDGTDMDIDRCIVAPDFEATVTDRLEYIDQDYVNDKRVQTVKINHCDGIGMMLPGLSKASDPRSDNVMVRGPRPEKPGPSII